MKTIRLMFVVASFLICNLMYAYSFENDNILYKILDYEERTVSVVGAYYGDRLQIPESVNDWDGISYQVVSIGDAAFRNWSDLSSITFPKSLKSIGAKAFYDCTSLYDIDLPDSLERVGEAAFENTGWWSSYSWEEWTDDNFVYLDGWCLGYKGSKPFGDFWISHDDVKGIADGAFKDCTEAYTISLNSNISIIGSCAFSGCTSLSIVDFPDNLKCIGDGAFRDCTNLRLPWNFPAGLTSIGVEVFMGCTSLYQSDIEFPNSLEYIGDGAFKNTNLGIVTFSEGLKTIGNSAFLNSFRYGYQINLPNSLESIGDSAFYNCTGTLRLSDGLISIGNYSFGKCSGIPNELKLPNKLISIGKGAFAECRLETVELPASLENLGSFAFHQCSNLKKIYLLGETPCECGVDLFYGASPIILVPESAIDIYQTASGWYNVAKYITSAERMTKSIEVTASSSGSAVRNALGNDLVEDVVNLSIKGTINSYDIIVLNQKMPILQNLDLSEAQIIACSYPYYNNYCTADSTLSDYLFYERALLRSIKLPQRMKGNMGEAVFSGCGNLEEVSLPNGIKSIGNYAFNGCGSLSKLTLPEGITNIGAGAFQSTWELFTLLIPNGVTSIGNKAFYDSNIQNITLPTSLTSIGNETFSRTRWLNNITLPPRLESIGSRAFYDTYITVIHLPSSLKSIGEYAFGVTSYGYYGRKLSKVYVYSVLPINITDKVFPYASEVQLYIPESSSEYYYFAEGWNKFSNQTTFNEPYEYFYLDNDIVFDDNTGYIEGEDSENPDVDIYPGGGLVVDGNQTDDETPNQSLGNVNVENDGRGNSGSIIGDNNLSIDNLAIKINVTSGKWYFFAFPFDIKLEDITLTNGGSYVWRYYDGEERAKGNTGWKTVNGNKLNAAQGYIFQCSKSGVLTLNIENVRFKKEDKYLELMAHVSNNLKDASWNYVGNPYLSYYDMSDLEYTAPVTRWDGSKYVAMRPGDDEYHFTPFEAFFVQKSEGTESVGFDGDKQMTQKQSQNKKAQAAAAPKMQVMSESEEQPTRQLINLVLTSGEQTDGTRIVFNEAQSRAYEAACDAAKFETQGVIQLFTIGDQKERYAINERPADNGIVALGFSTPTAGDFTISAARMDTPVYLKDRETGSVYDLRQGVYQFSAGAGTHANRFEVLLEATVTGIQEVGTATEGDATKVYDLGGRRVKENGKGVYIINGEKTLVK